MASVNVNIAQTLAEVKSIFDLLRDREYLLRPLAIETIANIKERIHEQGRASDGGKIGQYSSGYMRQREKNNRGKSTEVIVSLTRQLENDYQVLGTVRGYAIGFSNPHNFDKSQWVEKNQGKIIFNTTAQEKEYILDRAEELVNDAINGV